MKRGVLVGALVVLIAVTLAGCADFQQRAVEIRTAIQEAQETAQTAEDAAVHNTARLLELTSRVEALERALEAAQEEIQLMSSSKETTPSEE